MMSNGTERRTDMKGNPMRTHVRWLFVAIFASLILVATLLAVSEESEGIEINVVYRDPSTVDLEWTQYQGENFSRYELDKENTNIHTESDINGTFFRVQSLERNKEYNFTIRVFNQTNEEQEKKTITIVTGDVRGVITVNTTWASAKSPYNFSGDVTLQPGVTLTIDKNVTANCGDNEIIVNGILANLDSVTFLGHGIKLNNQGGFSITNCTFNGTKGKSIDLDNCSVATLEGIKIINGAGGILITGSDGCALEGISFLDSSGSGITLRDSLWNTINNTIILEKSFSGINLDSSNNNTITNATIVSDSGAGITLQSSSDNTILSCRISNVSTEGIGLKGASHRNNIRRIELKSIKNTGVFVQGNENNFTDITINGCTGYGIGVGGSYNSFLDIMVEEAALGDMSITTTNCSVKNSTGNVSLSESTNCLLFNVTGNVDLDNSDWCNITSCKGIIGLSNSRNNTISHNIVNDGYEGIALYFNSHHNTISNNVITNATRGIRFRWYCKWNTAKNNEIKDCYRGIYLSDHCRNNTFALNKIMNSTMDGMYVYQNHDTNFTANDVSGSGSSGFIIWSSHGNAYTKNDVQNNSNMGFHISESNNITLKNNVAKYNRLGFYINRGTQTHLIANMAENNSEYGMDIWYGANNTIEGNTLRNSTESGKGIGLRFWGTTLNTIEGNVITDNNRGIELCGYAVNNTFTRNIITNNSYGFYIRGGSYNTIYDNYFNNTKNAYDINGNNFWNVTNRTETNIIGGPKVGGNYWHDYYGTDTDGDGLGDTLVPYTSNDRITFGGDYLPLPEREPVWNLDTGKGYFNIQDAIDDVKTLDGHVIQVGPGTYRENVKVTKEVIIKAAGSYEDTMVEAANGNDHVFEFQRDVIIMTGFRITGATGEGMAGVYISASGARSGRGASTCVVSKCYLTGNCHGILIDNSTYNAVNWNVISGNANTGLVIQGSSAKENTVKNNDIGLEPERTDKEPNLHGVMIRDGANLNVIGGDINHDMNIISGNTETGVTIEGNGTTMNYIWGNYIGIGDDGESAIPNKIGVHVKNQARENEIGGNTIYDKINVISGNTIAGVIIEHKWTMNNTVGGNLIGTNFHGTSEVGNKEGVIIRDNATGNFVGKSYADYYNIISGNTDNGVVIRGLGTDENRVWGNIIGTNHDGDADLGNHYGVMIMDGARNTRIGDWRHQGRRNTISGNDITGITLKGEGTERTLVEGNFVGTNNKGLKAVPNFNGIAITEGAGGNTIGGEGVYGKNIISGNLNDGIIIYGSNGNLIFNNYIGTNVDGTSALGNQRNGICIDAGSMNNWIGPLEGFGNLISGNTKCGIDIDSSIEGKPITSENYVLGNLIGTDIHGSTAIPNGKNGVNIFRGSSNNYIGGWFDGKNVKSNRNVISGNTLSGIAIWGLDDQLHRTQQNEVIHNYIGLSKDGTKAVPNEYGVTISVAAIENYIGTYESGGNVISGNLKSGVLISYPFTRNNHVLGNLIGTSPDGETAIPNEEHGIEIKDKASFNYIGGKEEKNTVKSMGNLISGNGKCGISFSGFYTRKTYVLDNKIGTNCEGTEALPNQEYGVQCRDHCEDIWIGTMSGGGNLISGNEKGGIYVDGPAFTRETLRILIMDNLIGTKKDGKTALPNNGPGIELGAYAKYIQIGGEFEGPQAKGNTISGNKGSGILSTDKSIQHAIMGNYIGLTSDGKSVLPNQRYGLEFLAGSGGHYVGASPLTYYIGFKVFSYKNVHNVDYHNTIGGNRLGGILMDGSGTNSIHDNFIGTDIGASGLFTSAAKLGNGGYGITTRNVKGDNEIMGNHIWYNAQGGISNLNDPSSILKDNSIKYNGGSTGIHLDNSSPEITANTIFGDSSDGIFCDNGSIPVLRYNNIYNNTGFAVNNVDGSVTIDAQYNYWGAPGDQDGFSGNVDSSFELPGGIVDSHTITVNGTNITGFFNDSVIISYSITSNTTLTLMRFSESPVGKLNTGQENYYILQASDPRNIIELKLHVFYDHAFHHDKNESDIRFNWWDDDKWIECSSCDLNATDLGNFSGHVLVEFGDPGQPGIGELDELLFCLGFAGDSGGEPVIPPDDDGEDDYFPMALLGGFVMLIIIVVLVLYLTKFGDRTGKEKNEKSGTGTDSPAEIGDDAEKGDDVEKGDDAEKGDDREKGDDAEKGDDREKGDDAEMKDNGNVKGKRGGGSRSIGESEKNESV